MLELSLTSSTQQSSAAPSSNSRKPLADNAEGDSEAAFEAAYDAANEDTPDDASVASEEGSSSTGNNSETETDRAALETEKSMPSDDFPIPADITPSDTVETPEFAVSETPQKTLTAAVAGDVDQQFGAIRLAQPAAPKDVPGKEGIQILPDRAGTQSVETPKAPPQPGGGSTAENVVLSKAAAAPDPGVRLAKEPPVHIPAMPVEDSRLEAASRARIAAPQIVPSQNTVPIETEPEIPLVANQKRARAFDSISEDPRSLKRPVIKAAPTPTVAIKTNAPSLVAKPVLQTMKIGLPDDKILPIPMDGGDADAVMPLEQRAAGQITSSSFGQVLGRTETPTMIARQMAEALQKLPDRPVEISLNPRELGRVRMHIAAAEAGITVHVVAERPETLDLMRRNIEQLGREFAAMGYNDINFAFAEGEARQNSGNENQDSQDSPATKLQLDPVETEDMPSVTPIKTSGVDIRL